MLCSSPLPSASRISCTWILRNASDCAIESCSSRAMNVRSWATAASRSSAFRRRFSIAPARCAVRASSSDRSAGVSVDPGVEEQVHLAHQPLLHADRHRHHGLEAGLGAMHHACRLHGPDRESPRTPGGADGVRCSSTRPPSGSARPRSSPAAARARRASGSGGSPRRTSAARRRRRGRCGRCSRKPRPARRARWRASAAW